MLWDFFFVLQLCSLLTKILLATTYFLASDLITHTQMGHACKILLGEVLEWPEHRSLQRCNPTLTASVTSDNIYLCLCFLNCKMERIMPTSQGSHED